MSDYTEKARKLAINLNSFASREDINTIAAALREAHEAGRMEGLEKAADLVDAHEEVTQLKTGKRLLHERTDGNLVGLAYAEAIRAIGRKS